MNLVLAILASLLTSIVMGRSIFGSLESLLETLRILFTPKLLSILIGVDDREYWALLKILVWLIISLAIGYWVFITIN